MIKIKTDLYVFMDLQTAASWAEILGLVTILGAAIYSWFQIRELRRSRDSTTAMNLAANFQSQDFVVGLTTLLSSGLLFWNWDEQISKLIFSKATLFQQKRVIFVGIGLTGHGQFSSQPDSNKKGSNLLESG